MRRQVISELYTLFQRKKEGKKEIFPNVFFGACKTRDSVRKKNYKSILLININILNKISAKRYYVYYGQIRFITKTQRYLTLEKPINIFLILTDKGGSVFADFNRLREKAKHVIKSNTHEYIFSKFRMKENFFNLVKGI